MTPERFEELRGIREHLHVDRNDVEAYLIRAIDDLMQEVEAHALRT